MGTISMLGTGGRGFVLGLMIATVSGCALTTGTGTRSLGVEAPGAPLGYVVCSGGHTSRFPAATKAGQVCRRSATLHDIL